MDRFPDDENLPATPRQIRLAWLAMALGSAFAWLLPALIKS